MPVEPLVVDEEEAVVENELLAAAAPAPKNVYLPLVTEATATSSQALLVTNDHREHLVASVGRKAPASPLEAPTGGRTWMHFCLPENLFLARQLGVKKTQSGAFAVPNPLMIWAISTVISLPLLLRAVAKSPEAVAKAWPVCPLETGGTLAK